MQRALEGKIALVTGGSRGIGAAIAKRLAAHGANVAITYTKGADAAASVVKEIEGRRLEFRKRECAISDARIVDSPAIESWEDCLFPQKRYSGSLSRRYSKYPLGSTTTRH